MKRFQAGTGILVLIATAITLGCDAGQEGDRNGAPQVAQKQRLDTLVIPDGANVVASLKTQLSTATSNNGDPFEATTTAAMIVAGRTALPAGASIHGVLSDVQASGRMAGRARMTLSFKTIVDAQGETRTISAQPLTLEAASATHGDVERIAAGGILGAIVGGIAGGTKGAAIGAGAGAGAGTILMLATKGDDLELNPGQKLSVYITGPTSVQVAAQR